MSTLDREIISLKELAGVLGGSIMTTQIASFSAFQQSFGHLMDAPGSVLMVGTAAVGVYISAKEWLARRAGNSVKEFPKGLASRIAHEIDGIVAVQGQGAWVVWQDGRPVEVMSQDQFSKLRQNLGASGKSLVTLSVKDGRAVMRREQGGKLHCEDGPSVVEWDAQGNVGKQVFCLNGSAVREHDFEEIMGKRTTVALA